MDEVLEVECGRIVNKPELTPIARNIKNNRDSCIRELREQANKSREAVYAQYGEYIDNLKFFEAASDGAIDWAHGYLRNFILESDYDTEHDLYHGTLLHMADRCVDTLSEIINLLEGGFYTGAMARARTIQELFVVIIFLAVHGNPEGEHPDLIRRFLDHADIFDRKFADELINSGYFEDGSPLSEAVCRNLQVRRKRLIGQYGNGYQRGSWGWASSVVNKTDGAIGIADLANKIDIEDAAMYRIASRYIHASSEGFYEYLNRSNNQLPIVSHIVSSSTLLALQSVVPVRIVGEKSHELEGKDWLDAMQWSFDELRKLSGEPID